MAEFQAKSTTLKNNSIIIKNCTFYILNKFVYNEDLYVTAISKEINSGVERKLIFAQSKSECGMWRLCISDPKHTDEDFYFQKGFNYTMSAFIILELQIFVNSILKYVEDITISNYKPYRICQSHFSNMNDTIGSRFRSIDEGEFNANNYTVDTKTIQKINNYHYDSVYTNYKPVSVQSNTTTYNNLNEEDKKKLWPEKNEPIAGMDRTIKFGNTNLKVDGSIYSVILDKWILDKKVSVIFYYMIYSCNITMPADIIKYNSVQPNTDYIFNKKIVGTNFIIPIYAIPKEEPELNPDQIDVTGYGLYNFFCAFKYKDKDLYFSKILSYIPNCTGYTDAQTCTTAYKFMGYVYNKIDILNNLKNKTVGYVYKINNILNSLKNKTTGYLNTIYPNKQKQSTGGKKSRKIKHKIIKNVETHSTTTKFSRSPTPTCLTAPARSKKQVK